jgi:hypothetical protein
VRAASFAVLVDASPAGHPAHLTRSGLGAPHDRDQPTTELGGVLLAKV